MREAFVYSPIKLDATIIENLLPILKWSEAGSNQFNNERRAQTHWRDYLQDLDGNEVQCILVANTSQVYR